MCDQFFGDFEFAIIRAVGFEFGSGESFGNIVEHLGKGVSFVGADFEDFACGEQGVIKSIKVFGEEHMTGDLSCKWCADFFHAAFNKAVTGFAHYRDCAVFFHEVYYCLGNFDIKNHLGVGDSGDEVFCE